MDRSLGDGAGHTTSRDLISNLLQENQARCDQEQLSARYEDRIERQPDHQAKDDHTDADRPDRLQADNCIMTIKAESETDDEYFNDQEPQSSFDKKCT